VLSMLNKKVQLYCVRYFKEQNGYALANNI
jgi:hypothetical protein